VVRVVRDVTKVEPSGSPTVISFDPGGTTGWAVFTVHPSALDSDDFAILDNIIHWEQGQIEGSMVEQAMQIAELLDLWDDAVVLFEDFELMTVDAELSPVRLLAMSEWICQTMFMPVRPMFLQMPNMKETASDDRLKRWKLFKPGPAVHARDATRHGIVFLRRAKENKKLRAAAWPNFF
jgi:hypothetical protein